MNLFYCGGRPLCVLLRQFCNIFHKIMLIKRYRNMYMRTICRLLEAPMMKYCCLSSLLVYRRLGCQPLLLIGVGDAAQIEREQCIWASKWKFEQKKQKIIRKENNWRNRNGKMRTFLFIFCLFPFLCGKGGAVWYWYYILYQRVAISRKPRPHECGFGHTVQIRHMELVK